MKKLKLVLYKVIDLPELPEGSNKYPFKNGDTVLMLGELKHMPGHVAVVTKDGKTHFGYHAENFVKIKKGNV